MKIYENKNIALFKFFETFVADMFRYFIGSTNGGHIKVTLTEIFSILIENSIEITTFIAAVKYFVSAVLYYYFNGEFNTKIIAYCFSLSGLSSYFIYNYVKDYNFFGKVKEEIVNNL